MRDFSKISHFLLLKRRVNHKPDSVLSLQGKELIIYLDGLLPGHSNRLPSDTERATLSCRYTWRCTL